MVAITRRRRPRHTRLARIETDSKLYEWLAARAETASNGGIGDTAAAKTFTVTAANVAATGTLTLTGNVTADDTVTIGSTVYTFKATPSAAFEVDVGATASDSLDNLIAAINAGAGAGTAYGTGTTAHPTVTAAAGSGDTMVVTAITAGTGGNSIATTETIASNGSWGAATLAGGVSDGDKCASTAHGFSTGDAVTVSSTTTLPGGLAASTVYFVGRIDANNFYLASSIEKLRNASYVDITTAGTGTHTARRAATVAGILAWLKRGKKPEFVNALTDIDNI